MATPGFCVDFLSVAGLAADAGEAAVKTVDGVSDVTVACASSRPICVVSENFGSASTSVVCRPEEKNKYKKKKKRKLSL